jgi:hypothetical protein
MRVSLRDDTSHGRTPTDGSECTVFVPIDIGNKDGAKM